MEPLEPWLNPPLILNTLNENDFVPVCKRKLETFKVWTVGNVSRKDLLKRVQTSVDL